MRLPELFPFEDVRMARSLKQQLCLWKHEERDGMSPNKLHARSEGPCPFSSWLFFFFIYSRLEKTRARLCKVVVVSPIKNWIRSPYRLPLRIQRKTDATSSAPLAVLSAGLFMTNTPSCKIVFFYSAVDYLRYFIVVAMWIQMRRFAYFTQPTYFYWGGAAIGVDHFVEIVFSAVYSHPQSPDLIMEEGL